MRFTALLLALAMTACETPAPSTSPSPVPTVTFTAEPQIVPSPYAVPGPTVTVTAPAPLPSPCFPLPGPSASPSPSPVASSSPSPAPAGADLVIDGFERPEFASDSQWRRQVARTILDGAATHFVVKPADACRFSAPGAQVYKMRPTVTQMGSGASAKPGTYYDALPPLNAANCSSAKYVVVDVPSAGRWQLGDAVAVVTAKGKLPAAPVKPMMMLADPNYYNRGHFGSTWTAQSATIGLDYLKAMRAHRLHPYNSALRNPDVVNGELALDSSDPNLSYRKRAIDFNPSYIYLPNFGTDAALQAANASAIKENWQTAWFYTADERADQVVRDALAKQKQHAPAVRRMVTAGIDADLKDATILCPLASRFDIAANALWNGSPEFKGEAAYAAAGKELWLYVSCDSNGCADGTPGPENGAPDLVMDKSAVESFGFALLTARYPSAKALLYYATAEAFAKGLDLWAGQTWLFGGHLDGTLFWPGKPGIEGLTAHQPVLSIRLKLLREAQNFRDLLAQVPDQAWVQARSKELMTNGRVWKRDLKAFEQFRQEAFDRL